VAVLVDTCVYLWILSGSERLDGPARESLDRSYPRYVGALSFAEIEIKRSLGKLVVPDSYGDNLEEIGLSALSYSAQDSAALATLPFHHKDPFDRMLIAQAIARDVTIITADPVFQEYPVGVTLIG